MVKLNPNKFVGNISLGVYNVKYYKWDSSARVL